MNKIKAIIWGTVVATLLLGAGVVYAVTVVEHTYGNGNVLKIYDDGTSPVEVLKAELVKPYFAADGDRYDKILVEATMNDLDSEIANLQTTIDTATARKADLVSKKAALQARLDKLPARP